MVNKFEAELIHATEAEFLAALKLHLPQLFQSSNTERDTALRKWKASVRRNPSPGQTRPASMRRAFADAERLLQTGVSLDDALKQALDAHSIEYPRDYKNDENAWLRKIKQTYLDIPTHVHELLEIEVPYGLRHAQDAMIAFMPDFIAAIFVTSNSATRRKIIAFVFQTVRTP
jgi:hypothetical protein